MQRQSENSSGLNRRNFLKGVTTGVVGAGLIGTTGAALAESSPAAPTKTQPAVENPARHIWKLDRPKSALPNSYFWTWDHSTNWMLDDPGMLNFGCVNRYMKRPETYVEDYRRLTDMASGLGIKGVLIWGFLRDDHGGIDSSKRVADYAASRGVSILPGLGTNAYGGIYYEGNHKYNLETFTAKYPDARVIGADGRPEPRGVCPTHPDFKEWLQSGIQWLFKEFAVGGANLENGDFQVCHCKRCEAQKAEWVKEPDFWRQQFLGYDPALRAVEPQLKEKYVTWATYKGFIPGPLEKQSRKFPQMECDRPALVDKMPKEGVAQWTLSAMLREKPLPLTAYLDDGAPKEAFENHRWKEDLKPPTVRSAGFIHQGSQWSSSSRYKNVVTHIKEGCLRAYRSGLEGVSIHGEMSSMSVPWTLNYLAFSHFTHWPEDSLRDFGKKTMSQVFDSPKEGEEYVERLAYWQAGKLTPAQKTDIARRTESYTGEICAGKGGANMPKYRLWNWLHFMAQGRTEPNTVSIC